MTSRWRLVLFALLLLPAIWGFALEPGWLQERRLSLESPIWTGRGLKIGLASDLHVGTPHAGLSMLRRVVDALNSAEPDLILLPGDFVSGESLVSTPATPETIALELSRLRAPLGVFATLGNHDWWYDGPRVKKALESAGIRVLENAAIPLPGAGENVWLVGIGDDMTGHAMPDQAFSDVPASAAAIVMMHDPFTASELRPNTVVAFAGHTHGGQVRLPGIGALITPGNAPRQHAYGWIAGVPAPTWVTAGVGTSILPVRFNCPPEVVTLHLTPRTTRNESS